MRRTLLVLGFVITGLLVGGTAQAAPIDISGTTAGCFGAGCSTFELDPLGGSPIHFSGIGGAGFDITTEADGSYTGLVLGTFSRDQANYTGTKDFTLEVTFTLPAGLTDDDGTFTAQVIGQASGGGADAWVDFVNVPQLFTYSNASGSGSFSFSVLDLGTGVGGSAGVLGKGDTLNLLGNISGATFIPNETPVVTPEPASLSLLGLGLAGAAMRRFRKRS